jgi:hypothetical protein
VTGSRLSVTSEPGSSANLVVIGSDSVNGFCRTAIEQGIIPPLGVGARTDAYRIRSAEKDGRSYLFLAGGNGRSTLYAVYDFFERQAGCRYFWDGDIVPKQAAIRMDGLDVSASPRFAYRGIRYFAHRSLDRFQAEHWGPGQWEREIDWALKKRLNLVMLRIGMDDVYQKAFPDIVPYPPTNGPLPDAVARSYDDRTSAWPLSIAASFASTSCSTPATAAWCTRGHRHDDPWYSRTPYAFLEKVKPVFSRRSAATAADRLRLGHRDDRNLDNYWKLTQAHIDNYGSRDVPHHRLRRARGYKDRAQNHEFKLYAYRRIIGKVRERYPQAPADRLVGLLLSRLARRRGGGPVQAAVTREHDHFRLHLRPAADSPEFRLHPVGRDRHIPVVLRHLPRLRVGERPARQL